AGIGERTSMLFDELGAQVIALDIDEERGRRLEEKSTSGRIKFRKIDLRDRAQLDAFSKWSEKKLDKIDVLINNAVIPIRNNVLDVSLEVWDSTIALHLTAAFLLSRLAAKQMIE